MSLATMGHREPAKIHIPPEVYRISDVLKHRDDQVVVVLVGGAVRDYLFNEFHGRPGQIFEPKDMDLATDLSEEEILALLRCPYAVKRGIKVHEKESVDTFGVVFVNCNGKDFEVAPFRKDVGSTDGRHPDRVERASMYEDAMRRDLTINNLYYDIDQEYIIDFNLTEDFVMSGQGIEDIRNKKVRFVGDPFQRIEEDKLRVLRLLRFFSRYNSELIINHLDDRTLIAISQYMFLRKYPGMSGERIQMEFLAGLKQSLNTTNYLRNYTDLGLLESAVFPNLRIDYTCIPRLGNCKNAKVVLANLLSCNIDVEKALCELNYPNDIFEPVGFLVDVLRFATNPKIHETGEGAVDLIRARDKKLVFRANLTPEESRANQAFYNQRRDDLHDLCKVVELTDDTVPIISHLMDTALDIPGGEELMNKGFRGPAIGREQKRVGTERYLTSLNTWLFNIHQERETNS